MQPPPRKGNYAKFLKNLQSEQLLKLQLKNTQECELLEDIRQFTIKRSAIEKSYSEALLKISSAYLNKKLANIPEIKYDGTERWNMWSVWQTVLEENEKLAKARLAAIEVFQQQIADEAKVLRDHKLHIAKKCINHLGNIHKELQNSVARIDLTKKSYFDEEHSAHGVRDKARDIEEKLKKKKGSFFQSITSLQKNSARVTTRKEELEEKSTGARNDYLLSLAAANAHQNRYFAVDLQSTMQTMESYVFERIAEYLTLMGRTELLTCSATQNSFSKIRDQAQQLTREYNVQCCYLSYPVLKQHIQYEFEPCDGDGVTKITAEHDSAAATLSGEAKLLAARIVRENIAVRDNSRKLQLCNTLREAGHRTDPNDPNGPDLETKIDEFREYVRRSETEKARAEACLECLRAGGVNVDEWMQEAETMGVQELPRSNSELSMGTDASGAGGAAGGAEASSADSFYDSDDEPPAKAGTSGAFETYSPAQKTKPAAEAAAAATAAAAAAETHAERAHDSDSDDSSVDGGDAVVERERQKIEQLTVGWDDPTAVDWGAEHAANGSTVAPPAEAADAEPIFKCTALYSYTAQNPDELSIVENEQLEVVGEGDGDGWLRARNYRGEEGYVPHNYLDVERDEPVAAGAGGAGGADAAAGGQQLTSQISFSSVDYTVDSDGADNYADSVQQSPDQVSVISAPLGKQQASVAAVSGRTAAGATATTAAAGAAPAQPPADGVEWCIALYDYDASAEDELTFEENQLIRIVNKSPHGVDDGWWEGELNGAIGNFPSLVVEECDATGEPLSELMGSDEEPDTPSPTGPPPGFMPPPMAAPTAGAGGEAGLEGLADAMGRVEADQRRQELEFSDSEPTTPTETTAKPSGAVQGKKIQFGIDLQDSNAPKTAYGKQFAGAPTPIMILEPGSDSDHADDSDASDPEAEAERRRQRQAAKDKKHVQVDEHPTDAGLGFVQISVTAATPMVEDAEKRFLDDGEGGDNDRDGNEQEATRRGGGGAGRSSSSSSSAASQSIRTAELEKDVAVAVDEILEEAQAETAHITQIHQQQQQQQQAAPQRPTAAPPAPPPIAPKPKAVPTTTPTTSTTKTQSKQPQHQQQQQQKQRSSFDSVPDSPPPPPPPAILQAGTSEENIAAAAAQAAAAEAASPPPAFEANFEAAFEAHFDDAFGADAEAPKQVVGGRASIPDELAPHQLARLQNLKESNA